ncbi:hypothetical protein LOK49_LG05G01114 [Camellia lanceoleosa]|uniref:Uncharacterized protein n=1 Tax=Camellia lanceoleosa TaxID=1840588 RepID=A0ACC0HJW5_9ERIC|nr:hypothetical protein LOK49_LG05G01114 [Camellia lanceoleosa]
MGGNFTKLEPVVIGRSERGKGAIVAHVFECSGLGARHESSIVDSEAFGDCLFAAHHDCLAEPESDCEDGTVFVGHGREGSEKWDLAAEEVEVAEDRPCTLWFCKETLSKELVEAVCSKINSAIHPSQKHNPQEEDGDKADDIAGAFTRANKGTTSGLKAMDELAVGGSWNNTYVVAETIDYVGNSNEADTCVAESVLPLISLHQMSNHYAQKDVEEQLLLQNLQEWVECDHDSQKRLLVDQAVEGQIITSSFIKSLSQSPNERPGIRIEIALGQDQNRLQPNEPWNLNFLTSGPLISGSNILGVEQPCGASGVSPQTKAIDTYRQPILGSSISHINKGKRKVTRRKGLKYSLLAGRFSGFASRVGHKGAGSSYGSK